MVLWAGGTPKIFQKGWLSRSFLSRQKRHYIHVWSGRRKGKKRKGKGKEGKGKGEEGKGKERKERKRVINTI